MDPKELDVSHSSEDPAACEGPASLRHSVELIPAAATRGLRHRVLRPDQPTSACVYPLDDHPDSAHFGAFHNRTLVGIASIFQESPDRPTPRSPAPHQDWRLRGMATDPEVRGKGYGGALLRACLRHVEQLDGRRLWCNGRTTVWDFYAHFGFQRVGDVFDLPGLGPHYLMERWLP